MTTKRPRGLDSMAIEQLILAYEKGSRNGSCVEWDDLDLAYQLACDARPGIVKRVRATLENDDD